MNLSISKLGRRLKNAVTILNGTVDLDQCVELTGIFTATVTRADGSVEEVDRKNIVVSQGLNRIAFRNASYANTIASYLAVGTQTAAHSLGTTQATIGEVSRKAAIAIVQSHEFFTVSATWAGAADGLTGILVDTGAICDYANSSAGSGIIYNAANGLAVTLQASDFLLLTASVRCGSHALGQST